MKRYRLDLTEWNVKTVMRALVAVGGVSPPPSPVAQAALRQAYETIRLQCLQQDHEADEKARKANAAAKSETERKARD